LIILAVATLLILVLSGFSSLLFLRIEQGAAAVESGFQAPVQSLNRELLRENIELFEERKSMLETLRSQKPSIEQP
jgi:hypothetical protein